MTPKTARGQDAVGGVNLKRHLSFRSLALPGPFSTLVVNTSVRSSQRRFISDHRKNGKDIQRPERPKRQEERPNSEGGRLGSSDKGRDFARVRTP